MTTLDEKIINQALNFTKNREATLFLDNEEIIRYDYSIENYFRLYDISPFEDTDNEDLMNKYLLSIKTLTNNRIDSIYNQIAKTKFINFDNVALVIYNTDKDRELNYHIGDITLLLIDSLGKGYSIEMFKEDEETSKYRLGIIRKSIDANELLYNKAITFPTSVKYGDFNRHYITKPEYTNKLIFCNEVAKEYKGIALTNDYELPNESNELNKIKVIKNKVNK